MDFTLNKKNSKNKIPVIIAIAFNIPLAIILEFILYLLID
jgi:hypothetical protein